MSFLNIFSTLSLKQLQERPWFPVFPWIILVVVLSVQTYTVTLRLSLYGMDFIQDYLAAIRMLAGGQIFDLFTPEEITSTLKSGENPLRISRNVHPPSLILLLIPFALLDYSTACLIFTLGSIAAWLLSIWLLLEIIPIPNMYRFRGWILLIFSLWYPFWINLNMGQVNSFILLFIVFSIRCCNSLRYSLSGFWLAICSTMKLFPAFLIIAPIFQMRYRLIIAFLLTCSILLIFSESNDFNRWYSFFTQVTTLNIQQWGQLSFNSGLRGLATRIFLGTESSFPLLRSHQLFITIYWLSLLSIILYVVTLCFRNRQKLNFDGMISFLIPPMLLICPLSWDHALILLLVTYSYVAKEFLINMKKNTSGFIPTVNRLPIFLILASFFLGLPWWGTLILFINSFSPFGLQTPLPGFFGLFAPSTASIILCCISAHLTIKNL